MDGIVRIYDTTLRDGCQGAGISLSLRDKLDIARRLDELGFDYIEGGWPGSNPKDAQFFAALRDEPLEHARVSAFGSTRHAGTAAEDDANLRTLIEAGTPTVALVAKSWRFQVDAVLRTTPEENLAMVRDSVAFMKKHDREVVLDAEHFFDGYRSDRDFALGVLAEAVEAGADWLALCDTRGGCLPDEIATAVADVVATLGAPVGIHTHNDCGLAVANALAAVSAGARQIQGTINGYGERVGNMNLCTAIPNLVLKMGLHCGPGEHLDRFTELSHFMDNVANVTPDQRAPFVGYAAFAHKGGIHVHAVAADPATYEHVDPAAVGNERRILVSELSGRSNVAERARQLGVDLDPNGPTAAELAAKVKQLEDEGFQFEDAEASFELVLRRSQPGYERPIQPLAYLIESTKGEDDESSRSKASAEVGFGGEVLRGTATGAGPIDALQAALRDALTPAFPQLEYVTLTDFRSQIAGGQAAAGRSPVRVRITASEPGGRVWTTVGSASDLLHATWLALADTLEYALVADAITQPAARTQQPPRDVTLADVADVLAAPLGATERAALATVGSTDWKTTTLDIVDPIDRAFAARATSLGACLFYNFANFCAVAAHPRWEAVRRVNLLKGRPENQVGSVTTTRDRFSALFDWRALPESLTADAVLALMDEFYGLGPMGFRGPAITGMPAYLTSLDVDIVTTQIIAPGYRCASNALVDEVLQAIGEDYLFITSANVSSGITGRVEPAHYDLAGIQQDFGAREGIVLIGHRDEATVRASYPDHLPMSTSIVAFHRVVADADGGPALVLERQGSLAVDAVRTIVERHGFGLVIGDGARTRLPMRGDPVPIGA